MAYEMSGLERLEAAIALQPVDRVPICPMIDFFAASSTGLAVDRFIFDADACEDALLKCFAEFGGWDVTFNALIREPLAFSIAEMCRMKLPGQDLPPDGVWQFDEQVVLTIDDYDAIAARGFYPFLFTDYVPRILPGMQGPEAARRLEDGLGRAIEAVARWRARGVSTLRIVGTTTPFECFSKGRSLAQFASDLYREPVRLEAAMEVAVGEMARAAIAAVEKGGIPRVFVAGSRGSGRFLSKQQFERFYWPYLREMVLAFAERGIVSILHLDDDWSRNLGYLRDLPQGSCIVQLDGCTDIRQAREVLRDHMCIMGDVPATLLRLGSVSQVWKYVGSLLEDVGRWPGFILSSGCSVPVDAKPENVRALIEAGKAHKLC